MNDRWPAGALDMENRRLHFVGQRGGGDTAGLNPGWGADGRARSHGNGSAALVSLVPL